MATRRGKAERIGPKPMAALNKDPLALFLLAERINRLGERMQFNSMLLNKKDPLA